MAGVRSFLLACIAAAAVFSIAPVTHAHGDLEHEFSAEITPREAIQGDELPIEAYLSQEGIPLTGRAVTFTIDSHAAAISDRRTAVEREPGHYTAKYRFMNAGEYEVHAEWVDAATGETERATGSLDVLRTSIFTPGTGFALGAGALIIAALIVGIARRKMKLAIVVSIVILVAAFLGYSLYSTFTSGAASRGVVTCVSPDQCFWTAHVHAYVPIEICEEDFRLPIEKGALTGPHTHEEKNIIHWHDRLPYDTAANQIQNTDPLTLHAFFDAIGMPFDDTHIAQTANGDRCGSEQGTLKVFVNGKPVTNAKDYVWANHDVIVVVFDHRTNEEVETWLTAHPIVFPVLGRG